MKGVVTVKRIMLMLGGVCAAGMIGGGFAAETVPCESYNDLELNLAFPKEIAGMRMWNRSVFGADDYALLYVSREFVDREPGARVLSVYVFSRDGVTLENDGISEPVGKELESAVYAVRNRPEGAFEDVVVKTEKTPVTIGSRQGLAVNMECQGGKTGERKRGDVLVTGFLGKFIKLRSTEGMAEGVAFTSRWDEVVASVGGILDRAKADRDRDVYAIEDDAERLEALRRKWVGAGDRVPTWDMPDYQRQFNEISRFQEWCEEDKTNRYARFETACRDAVELKIDPPFWRYNLACALAFQGRTEEAFTNLEQAVAAGYFDADWAEKDTDFDSIRGDGRFPKLVAAMRGNPHYDLPLEELDVDAACHVLTERNVYYAFSPKHYVCQLKTTNECPIVYLNHHENHPDVPADGLICPAYCREAREKGYDKGLTVSFDFGVPTILASDSLYRAEPLGGKVGIPMTLATLPWVSNGRIRSVMASNVLGVFPAGNDYGVDGVDRFVGFFPWDIVNEGDAEESDKFVRLITEIFHAVPGDVRETFSAYQAMRIIRASQKCLKDRKDWMTGVAWRPVLNFKDIDTGRAMALAKAYGTESRAWSAAIDADDSGLDFDPTPVNDLWDSPWDHCRISGSPLNMCFVARWGEYTGKFRTRIDRGECREIVWKVLQGDPGKVRVRQVDDEGLFEIEVDYHGQFETPLADGRKLITSRVDIGFFAVKDDYVSIPSVVSVFFSPNETRVYDGNRRLVSVDYAKRQNEKYCPYVCAKGDWKDVFSYDADGTLTGWTRYIEGDDGRVSTNLFTREGLVIDTRDALGRPKDVHRSLRSSWMQAMNPTNLLADGDFKASWLSHFVGKYDHKEGDIGETTLAWKYTYTNDLDRLGQPSPKEPMPFKYRPELCTRADFTEESGFALPLVDQMELGYYRHTGYRDDCVGVNVLDLMREDNRYALEKQGLVPPVTLKKMRFVPWKPSTNDVWTCDPGKSEESWRKSLMELADGVYRNRLSAEGGGVRAQTVAETSRAVNGQLEREAYGQLDKRYRRRGEAEARKLLADRYDDETWKKMLCVGGEYVRQEDLPEGKVYMLTTWQLREDVYFVILGDQRNRKGMRRYAFVGTNGESGTIIYGPFLELPSPAIGNAVLGALAGDPSAENNFAVLYYAGIANPDNYDEETVIVMLEQAAREGCATAKYNLGVLYENRGEKSEAARCYDEARVMEAEGKCDIIPIVPGCSK